MSNLNGFAIVVATVAAFAGSLARNLVLAVVLARVARHAGVVDWRNASQMAATLWLGFPVILLAGFGGWRRVSWIRIVLPGE